jgi:hypothetical protein
MKKKRYFCKKTTRWGEPRLGEPTCSPKTGRTRRCAPTIGAPTIAVGLSFPHNSQFSILNSQLFVIH